MASYYKNVVLKDMENFWRENEPAEFPVRQYAAAKWFDPDLYSEFYLHVCNSEPLYSELGKWSKTDTFFRIPDEDSEKFSEIVAYYDWVAWHVYWEYSADDSWVIKNSANEIDKRWDTPRQVEWDPYEENRTYTCPKLEDKDGIVIPERYNNEWYQHDHWDVTQKEWILDPTKEDTPFEDYKPNKYLDLSPFNNFHEKDDHRHFIRHK